GDRRMRSQSEPFEDLCGRWGVPHIYARNTHDLYFTQGYVLASERLFQIEFMLRLGSGRLSELFGDVTLPIDRFIRTIGWNRAAALLLTQWDELAMEIGEAALEGMHAWMDRMPVKPIE